MAQNTAQMIETLADESREATTTTDTTIFETSVAQAYDEARTNPHGVSDEDLARAFGTFAAAFYEEGAPSDDEGNHYNDLRFQQRGMLGNLCNNADWMLKNAEKHLTDLFTELDQLEATFDETEIAIRKMNVCLDKIERCKATQIPNCRQWLKLAKQAYAAVLGEEWKPFVKGGRSPQQQSSDALKARIAQMREG